MNKMSLVEDLLYDWWLGLGFITRIILCTAICLTISIVPGIFFHILTGPFWREPDIHITMGSALGFLVCLGFSILWTRAARYAKALKETNEEKIEAIKKLAEANKILEKLCCLDPLTGVYSRQFLETAALNATKQAARDNTYIFSVVLDMDGLKQINDTFGHETGDEVIKGAASFLRRVFHDYDYIIRYGGDEFEAIGVTDSKEKLLQSLKEKIIPFNVHTEERKIEMSFSYGCAFEKVAKSVSVDKESDDELRTYAMKLHQSVFGSADAHMYVMKRGKQK